MLEQMYHVGQISQILRQASDFISEATMAGYRQQQETRGRIADAASQTIRGWTNIRIRSLVEWLSCQEGMGVRGPTRFTSIS